MTRHKIATADQLADHGARVIEEVGGQEIGVFNVDGELHAIKNYCVHEGGPLAEGSLGNPTTAANGGEWDVDDDNPVIACPWHSWLFDLKTGKNISDEEYSIPTFDVEVDGEDVYVVL